MKKVTRTNRPTQNAEVGKKIEYIRTKLSISQETLANMIGRKRPEITMWENGDRTPDIYTLKEIALKLGVTTDYLLGINDVETYDSNSMIINELTGLSGESIKVLINLKKYHKGYLLPTINYLIEQERIMSDDEYANLDTKDLYLYSDCGKNNMDVGKIQDIAVTLVGGTPTNKRIISMINKYFKTDIDDKEILYIRNKTLNKAINNDKDALDTEEFIYSKDIAETYFLKEIERLLESAKQDNTNRNEDS